MTPMPSKATKISTDDPVACVATKIPLPINAFRVSIPRTHESGMYVFKPSNTMKMNAELGADRTHVMPQPL